MREALDLIYSLNLQLPTRFVILDKTIATLGSVGIELYPEFNVFEVARPYARQLLAERFSPRRLSLRAQAEVRELGSVARVLPYQLRDVMEQTRQGNLEIQIRNPGFDDLTYHIDHAVNRLAVALIVLGGLVGSAIVGVLARNGPHVIGLHLLSFVGFMLSGIFAVWLVWGIARSGRL
jgi:ubiquinone biosynthesis protein